jgi:beta-glucanase (GH16 family)
MYVVANLAVGGDWPGAPDSTTVFPAKLSIAFIRAFRFADE